MVIISFVAVISTYVICWLFGITNGFVVIQMRYLSGYYTLAFYAVLMLYVVAYMKNYGVARSKKGFWSSLYGIGFSGYIISFIAHISVFTIIYPPGVSRVMAMLTSKPIAYISEYFLFILLLLGWFQALAAIFIAKAILSYMAHSPE